jgi:hypothetical protein
VAFTDAPPCWLQPPPMLKELFLEEGDAEEKESISKFEVVLIR